MKPTDIIFDSIRHEAKEATKDSPNMRFGVDMASFRHNFAEYFECQQKIKEENMQIYNINMQAKLRGYYTDFERNELDMHTTQRNEHIAKALKYFYSAGEDAYGVCKYMNDMYRQQQYQYGYWMQWR